MPEWLAQLPDEALRLEPSLAQINGKDWSEAGPALAKGYVEAQKLIGQNRLPTPQKDWDDKKWDEFYSKVGRPEKPDGYQVPGDLKLEEGVTLPPERLAAVREFFHKQGLNPRQAEAMIRFHAEDLNNSAKTMRAQNEKQHIDGIQKLRVEWGDKFDQEVDLAKGVLRKWGDDSLMEHLEVTGKGSDPAIIKLLAKIGHAVSEDDARGNGKDFLLKDSTQGRMEVDRLSADTEFQKALNNRDDPGHKDALMRWDHAFKIAYPGKQTEQE